MIHTFSLQNYVGPKLWLLTCYSDVLQCSGDTVQKFHITPEAWCNANWSFLKQLIFRWMEVHVETQYRVLLLQPWKSQLTSFLVAKWSRTNSLSNGGFHYNAHFLWNKCPFAVCWFAAVCNAPCRLRPFWPAVQLDELRLSNYPTPLLPAFVQHSLNCAIHFPWISILWLRVNQLPVSLYADSEQEVKDPQMQTKADWIFFFLK